MANDWAAQITSEPRAQYRPRGGLTPLLYAARSGCSRCVRAMLAAGAEIDQPNPDGVTALMVAIDNSHFDTARLLLAEGANPHYWDWWGRTALYVAVDISTNRRARGTTTPSETSVHDLMRLLLEAGVGPNSQLNMHRPNRGGNQSRFADDLLTTGATPLLRAALGRDVEAVRLLLAHGAAADLPNVMGVTPFMAAAGMGAPGRGGVVGGSVSSDGDVQGRAIETLELLRAAGADVNARIVDDYGKTGRIARTSSMTEREGQTPLYGAVRFGWTRVVTYLIENGAQVNVRDVRGKTPLDAATGNIGGRDNNPSAEIAELLRRPPRS
jgi:ankyrin repeat protein